MTNIEKLLIATASQKLKIREIYTRNGQLLLCNIGSEIFIEKTIDLIEYYTHTITPSPNNYALIGKEIQKKRALSKIKKFSFLNRLQRWLHQSISLRDVRNSIEPKMPRWKHNCSPNRQDTKEPILSIERWHNQKMVIRWKFHALAA